MLGSEKVGSENARDRYGRIKVFLSTEYLVYDFYSGDPKVKPKVEVTADFFCRNISAKPARLYGLHRGGNLKFEGFSGAWIKSEKSELFKTMVPKKYEMFVKKGNPVLWTGSVYKYRTFKNLECIEPTEKIIDGQETGDPFSMFKSELIAPWTDVVIRISTTLEGKVFEELVPIDKFKSKNDSFTKRRAYVIGGSPLEKEIANLLANNTYHEKYTEVFNQFIERKREHPEKYYFFVEMKGGLRTYPSDRSVEMFTEIENFRFARNRYITWCSSDSSLYKYEVESQKEPNTFSAKDHIKSRPQDTEGPRFELQYQ